MSLSVCMAPPVRNCSPESKWLAGAGNGVGKPRAPGSGFADGGGVPPLHTLTAGNSNDLAPGGAMHVISAGKLSARIEGLIESYDGGDRETAGRRLGIAPDRLDGLLSGDWRRFSLEALAQLVQ